MNFFTYANVLLILIQKDILSWMPKAFTVLNLNIYIYIYYIYIYILFVCLLVCFLLLRYWSSFAVAFLSVDILFYQFINLHILQTTFNSN